MTNLCFLSLEALHWGGHSYCPCVCTFVDQAHYGCKLYRIPKGVHASGFKEKIRHHPSAILRGPYPRGYLDLHRLRATPTYSLSKSYPKTFEPCRLGDDSPGGRGLIYRHTKTYIVSRIQTQKERYRFYLYRAYPRWVLIRKYVWNRFR